MSGTNDDGDDVESRAAAPADEGPSFEADDCDFPGERDGGQKGILEATYRDFKVRDLGDRYVAYLLRDDRTRRALQGRVLADHAAIAGPRGGDGDRAEFGSPRIGVDDGDGEGDASGFGGEEGGNVTPAGERAGAADASIEIDAFRLLSIDPVLGNLTLRYPDTLLGLLEDSTIWARRVLRGRVEAALRHRLEELKRSKPDMGVKNVAFKTEVNDMIRLLRALRRTGQDYYPRPLRARLVHLPPRARFCKPTLASLSARDVGSVVQIRGTCVRAGPVRMMETSRKYTCVGKDGCGTTFVVEADFGTANNALHMPPTCPSGESGGECRSTSFAIVPDGSERADYQEIKVQESASALMRAGSAPRSLLVKLGDDLVDRCRPGDEVVAVGELKAEWRDGGGGPGVGVEAPVGTCLRAHSVRVVNVDDEFGGGGAGAADLGGDVATAAVAAAAGSGNLRERYRREFDAFWSGDGARRRPIAARDYVVRAMCPKLFGMHAVKLGLLLALIGGAAVSTEERASAKVGDDGDDDGNGKMIQEEEDDHDSDEHAPVAFKVGDDDEDEDDEYAKRETKRAKVTSQNSNKGGKPIKSRRRIQSHILMIGDPGTGKSQFLRFAAALSPRAVLTTGTGSSTAGLTCAAVRDQSTAGSNGNEFSLEAGALALADRGVCCIDEFGCMSKEDRTSIHEAMEQQTISVAKAGIVCKLNARATVVAVMNPSGGLYDNTVTLEQNSRLGSALLSRFDLIFVMLDQAEAERDESIATFLLQHSITPRGAYEAPLEVETLTDDDNVRGHWSMEKLRAYISTVRDKFRPTLTREASELLESHYWECRRKQHGQSIITVRFLESLLRLSQAHARLMYRDKVLLDDAVAVVLLMECTAAASGGGIFGSGGGGVPFDDYLYRNPIDTEFFPFDEADARFEDDKQTLLRRYQGRRSQSSDGRTTREFKVSPMPSNSNARDEWDEYAQSRVQYNGFDRNREEEDQWGRQKRLSQVATPRPTSKKNRVPSNEKMGTCQLDPSLNHGDDHYTDNAMVFSQQSRQYPVQNGENIYQLNGGEYNFMRDGCPNRSLLSASGDGNHIGHMTQQSGGFIREDESYAHYRAHADSPNNRCMPHHGNASGKRRKHRRSSD
ncbi:hypothetical protein ACHAWF_013052 [Thalassiosira exigua]